MDGSNPVTIKVFSTYVWPLILANGKTIVWQEDTSTIKATDFEGTTETTVISDDHINRWYTYHPVNESGLLMGSDRADGNIHVFRINVDGSGLAQLTSGSYQDEAALVSPDGLYLSYLRLPADFNKASSPYPYPSELVVKAYVETPVSDTEDIPGYNLYLVFGISGVICALLVKKRSKVIR